MDEYKLIKGLITKWLLVKIKFDVIQIHGIALFADEVIAEGGFNNFSVVFDYQKRRWNVKAELKPEN